MRAALALTLLFPALAQAPDGGLRFTHVEGRTLRTTVLTEFESNLASSDYIIDGEELEPMEATDVTSASVEYSLVDEEVEVEDGELLRLDRSIEGVVGSFANAFLYEGMEEEEVYEADFACELEGEELIFERGRDGEFEVRIAGDREVPAELLALAVHDVSFAAFLPDEEVEEGDEWEVESELMNFLLMPGGDVGIYPTGEDEDPSSWEPYPQGEEQWSGTIEVVHAGLVEEDGRRLIALDVEFEVAHSVEYDPEEMHTEAEEEEGIPVANYIREENSREGEGRILWDPVAQRAHSLRFDVDVEERHLSATEYEYQGYDPEVHEEVDVYEISFTISIRIEEVE